LHRAPVPLSSDFRGPGERRNFVAVFDEARKRNGGARVRDNGMRSGVGARVEGGNPFKNAPEVTIPRLIHAQGVEEAVVLREKRLDPFVDRLHGMSLVDSKPRHGATGTEAGPVPELSLRLARPQEQDRLVLGGAQPLRHEDRFRLVEPGEVVKITIGAERVQNIPVSESLGRRRQNQHSVAEPVEQTLTPPAKALR